MDTYTLAPSPRRAGLRRRPICRHASIRLATSRPLEFIDLTARLDALVARAGLRVGALTVQARHTTTAIVVNEHEPLLLADFEALLGAAAPADGRYRHDDAGARTVNVTEGERVNGHAHCRALLLPTSVSLAVAGGRLCLGRWQRVFLVELDGPQDREVAVVALGEGGRRPVPVSRRPPLPPPWQRRQSS